MKTHLIIIASAITLTLSSCGPAKSSDLLQKSKSGNLSKAEAADETAKYFRDLAEKDQEQLNKQATAAAAKAPVADATK